MQIENYREQAPGTSVVALFDIYLPQVGLTLRNLKLMKGKFGEFIGYPSFATENHDGTKSWFPYFSWTEEKKKEFDKEVLRELYSFKNQSL